MRAPLGRLWSTAPRPLRLAAAVLAVSNAVTILVVLVALAFSGEDVDTVAVTAGVVLTSGLLLTVLAVLLLRGGRVVWLLSVLLLVATLTAGPVDPAPVSLAFRAPDAFALLLLLLPATLRAVWQRPDPYRQSPDLRRPD